MRKEARAFIERLDRSHEQITTLYIRASVRNTQQWLQWLQSSNRRLAYCLLFLLILVAILYFLQKEVS